MAKQEGWQKPIWLAKLMGTYHDDLVTRLDAVQNLFKTSGDADFASEDLKTGKTAYNGTTLISGSMPDNGAKTATLAAGGSYTIPKGYHNGNGKVTATDLASQTAGTATEEKMLVGITAWVDGEKKTGTMANKAGTTVEASAVSQDDEYTYLTVPANGYYSTASKIRTENSNLVKEITFTLRAYYASGSTADYGRGRIILDNSDGHIKSITYNGSADKASIGSTTVTAGTTIDTSAITSVAVSAWSNSANTEKNGSFTMTIG